MCGIELEMLDYGQNHGVATHPVERLSCQWCCDEYPERSLQVQLSILKSRLAIGMLTRPNPSV